MVLIIATIIIDIQILKSASNSDLSISVAPVLWRVLALYDTGTFFSRNCAFICNNFLYM